MATLKDKWLFIRNGAETERFHTVRTLHPETVGHHSFGVAWLCYLLADEEPSASLLLAAMQHDLAEHKTGDIPSPAKHAMGIHDHCEQEENRVLAQVGMPPRVLEQFEERILKFADIYDGMMTVQRERAKGNTHMAEVWKNFSSYAVSLNPVGVELELYHILRDLWTWDVV